jgi:Whi5 like
MLRTKLQLAAFKVKTNQINTPFSRLRYRQTPPALPPLPHLPYIKSDEGKIWGSRSVFGDDDGVGEEPRSCCFNSLPSSAIIPAAHPVQSSLLPKLNPERELEEHNCSYSPASSDSKEFDTPRATRIAPATINQSTPPKTPMRFNSPSSGEVGRADDDAYAWQSNEDVPSSVAKGEAANGLLDLIRAAAESGRDS